MTQLSLLYGVRIEPQEALITSKEYFSSAHITPLDKLFARQFIGLETPATRGAILGVHEVSSVTEDQSVYSVLSNKTLISISQFRECVFKNFERRNELSLIFHLLGRDLNIFVVSAQFFCSRAGCFNSGSRCFVRTFPQNQYCFEEKERVVSFYPH